MNILVTNIHSSRNSGDAALMLTALQLLRQNFPGSQITLAMDDPDTNLEDVKIVDSISSWVKSTGKGGLTSWKMGHLLLLPISTILPILTFRWFKRPIYLPSPGKIRTTIQAYLDSNLVVSTPGGFLYSSGSGLVLAIAIYTLALAWMAGKPFYIFPQSFGPLSHWWEGRLLRWILKKARIVMAREPVSLELLHKCGLIHPRLYLLPDIAFAFQGAPQPTAESWLHNQGIETTSKQPLLGLTIINWGAQNRAFKGQSDYENSCAEAIRYFVNQLDGKVVLFPQVTGPSEESDDRIPARRIKERLTDITDSIILVDQQLRPELLKALFGQMDAFIGTRMHSNILALTEGVPVIAIGYFHKTRGIAAMLELDQWVLDIQGINSKLLIEKLAALWQQRDALKSQITRAIPGLIEQANRAGILCAEDYNLLKKV